MKKNRIIAIDQSTSATKAMLFSEEYQLIGRSNVSHKQYYPRSGWVEHDPLEIYENVLTAIGDLFEKNPINQEDQYSLCITNQRETVVVWNKLTGNPIYNAIVWQDLRGDTICKDLVANGFSKLVKEKSGLIIDPYFAASGVKWILDNVDGARKSAEHGDLLLGTIDSWLIWKLSEGKVHATDHTNASRTLLFNIHKLTWDEDLLGLFTIPSSMLPQILPCDSVFGKTTVNNLFKQPILIAGVIGDSHGALTGQMCFEEGLGKTTYGTGSSVMVNIGEKAAPAPEGLVTSIGFSALGKVFYAFEGNIHSTGATVKWVKENLGLIASVDEIESLASSVTENQGVYFVPAFAGLGAPWWQSGVKAAVFGLSFGIRKEHILRAVLESIAYQVNDLIQAMTRQAMISLKELRVDGGPTKNKLLMQFQADLLRVPVNCSNIEEASALGAVIMNGFARKIRTGFDQVSALRGKTISYTPKADQKSMTLVYEGWLKAVQQLIK
ncbi:MAG TPA: glycerol kinase GlpK [Chitinophagaceae bacterium]|nr:glycerol kinase GlpK [Chitinophagaceae bacterium]